MIAHRITETGNLLHELVDQLLLACPRGRLAGILRDAFGCRAFL
jgi:hypothetical protein